MKTIVVAIGANLPGPNSEPPLATCLWAVEQLRRVHGVRPTKISRWYRTLPDPPSDQPDYINGAIRLEGEAEPEALLAALHAIEQRAGRIRTVRNAARPLDLDLIAMDQLVRDRDPILPHPRMHLRPF
ncbi:MAG: 2-amino-4-hydroxy-6-hydroxymethyldihydropteridine diphosphokinase, partial [Pseudomonadota bacterium]|nr:2-amino-4-hydroxy-6-hydroxymethyldihydropteridine diphosphokinase [Pseudomonadota bacterium]